VVSPHPQRFALELSSQGAPVPLLQELVDQVLRHAGCANPPAGELEAALRTATADGTFGGARRCDVQLRAYDRRIEILVSANGGRIWQAEWPLAERTGDRREQPED
jgi:hypothetical protein